MRYYGSLIEIIAGNLSQGIEYDKKETIQTFKELDMIIATLETGNYIIRIEKK